MSSSASTLFKKAQEKRKGMMGFFADYDGAQELFAKSGAQYKVQGDYLRAGDAYLEAAECARKAKNEFQISEDFQEAATMFSLACSPKYDEVLDLAVKSLLDINRLSRAADFLMKAAQSVRDKGALEKSLSFYERAEKYYFADSQTNKCDKCKRTRADIYSELGQYMKALPLYEELAKTMLGGPMKYEASKLQMKAVLCRLTTVNQENRLVAVEDAQEQFDTYLQMNAFFQGSREEELLRMFVEAARDQDEEKFTEGLLLMQSLKMLDEWMTSALLVIKENLQESIL